jgi:uncharacterized membrane protein (DUF485 family)
MRRTRFEYYFRAIICFVFSIAFILISIFKPSLVKKAGVSIGIGIGIGIFFLVVGLINYFIAKEDRESEKQKNKRIEQLEKELNDLKGEKLNNY